MKESAPSDRRLRCAVRRVGFNRRNDRLRSKLKIDIRRYASFPRHQLLPEIVLQSHTGEGVFEQVGVGLDARTSLGCVDQLLANAPGNTTARAGKEANVLCGLEHGGSARIIARPSSSLGSMSRSHRAFSQIVVIQDSKNV